jgi:hypothetical protein
MNRISHILLVAGISSALGTGIAFASGHMKSDRTAEFNSDDPAQQTADTTMPPAISNMTYPVQAANSSTDKAIDWKIRHMKGGRFDIETLADDNSSDSDLLSDRASAEPGYISHLHRAIESNPRLENRLTAQNIEIKNIVGAEPAADGTITFYVR